MIVNAAIVLPLVVIVPVPIALNVNAVNVPPELNIRLSRFNVVVPGLNAVVPKSTVLNQLAVVSVCTDVPDPVNVKLGALVLVPPVVPNVNVLVIFAAAVKPPVPVHVNPVAVAIDKLVVLAPVYANTILPDPNAIERVLALLELNVPVVNVYPAKSNVPEVNVVVAVARLNVTAPANVVVPEWLIVNAAIGLPLGVIVPVPTIVTVKVVYVPPALNVNTDRFNDVAAGVVELPVKSNMLKKLPVVNDGTAVPELI